MGKVYRVVFDPCPFYGGIHEQERGTYVEFTGWLAYPRALWAAWSYTWDRPYGGATVLERSAESRDGSNQHDQKVAK